MPDSDDPTYDDEFQNGEGGDNTPAMKQMRQQIRNLEKQLKAASDGSARAAELERKLALTEMGANLKDPRAKYLPQTDDIEALREAAVDLGLVAPPAPDTPPEEAAALDRIANASAGGRSVPGGPEVSADQIAGMTQAEVIAWAAGQGKLEVQ